VLPFLIRRLAWFAATVVAVLVVTFVALRVAPGDPTVLLFDLDRPGSPAAIERLRRELALDRPIVVQFGIYAWRLARGDLGDSVHMRRPVASLIAHHLGPTLALAGAGIAIAILIGVSTGIVAALHRNRGLDYALTTGAMLGLAAPSFWLALLMIYTFAYTLRWVPIAGRPETPLEHLRALVLPATAIGLSAAAMISRMTRSAVLEVLHADYVRTARAKGIAELAVVLKHALRNAAIPIVTVIGLGFVHLLGGAVVIEQVFARDGLGRLVLLGVYNRDYPVVQGATIVIVLLVAATNMVIDIAYALLDPRISYA
jgi:peptide/nickel transport system permease protein